MLALVGEEDEIYPPSNLWLLAARKIELAIMARGVNSITSRGG